MNATRPTMLTPAARRDQLLADIAKAKDDDALCDLSIEAERLHGDARRAATEAITRRQVELHQRVSFTTDGGVALP